MKDIRKLRADEIDVRVGTINEKGATLLLYKDARVDMAILDESGAKWKRSHELINGNLFCTISVWDNEIKEWVSRQDVGVESNTEKEKGQASDAFKRAGFNFGIGRELYTAPFIWIGADKYNGFINGKTPQGKDRYATYDKFRVVSIGYDTNGVINELKITNIKTGSVVFVLGSSTQQDDNERSAPKKQWTPSKTAPASDNQKKFVANLLRQHGINDNDMKNYLSENYGVNGDMSQADAQMIIDDLNNSG